MRDAGELFDDYADSYDRALDAALAVAGESREYFAEQRIKWLKRCLTDLDETPRSLLDFGCGDGSSTPLLQQHLLADSAVGVDVSPKSLELARKKFASERIRYTLTESFAGSGQIDLAYCNGVFHHIQPQHRSAALAVIHSSLRPGGIFSFWENNPWSPATRYVMSRCIFDRDAIMLSPTAAKALLRENGFDTIRTDFRFIFPHALRVFRKLEDFVFRLPLGGQYQILCRKIPVDAMA
jgi:SAM-dependent methyltransferase